MKNVLRIVIGLVLLVVVVAVGAAGLGMLLPRRHVAATSTVVHRAPELVWAAIADLPGQPAWRSDLKSVTALPERDGDAVWLLKTVAGDWPLRIVEAEVPLRLVASVADSAQGFGGTWTYELVPEEGDTRLTITERGFIDQPLFRFLARFVFGLHGSQETFLRDLGRHFDETVTLKRER